MRSIVIAAAFALLLPASAFAQGGDGSLPAVSAPTPHAGAAPSSHRRSRAHRPASSGHATATAGQTQGAGARMPAHHRTARAHQQPHDGATSSPQTQ